MDSSPWLVSHVVSVSPSDAIKVLISFSQIQAVKLAPFSPSFPSHPRMFLRVPFLFCLVACISFSVARTKNPKRGIGYAGDLPGDIINANQTKSVISWQYNWANIPPDYLATSNITYIPMQWGSVNVDSFADDVKAQGADTILVCLFNLTRLPQLTQSLQAFNEPDYVNESNLPPDEAAKLWMQFIEPLKSSGIRLGGPAVTASGTGRPWLNSFLQACTNCTIDFLPLHW